MANINRNAFYASPTPSRCRAWWKRPRASTAFYGRKKTGQKAGFSFLDPELLGSGSGSSSSSASSFASSGCSFVSSSSFSSGGSSFSGGFASFDSSFASFDSSFASFDSSFSSRCFSRRSGFFFLAASGHGNSQQSSQEDGIFHLISLKLQYIKI
ncbi:MAG: hypothetical protein ACYC02_05540 [Thiobacillus sp.]